MLNTSALVKKMSEIVETIKELCQKVEAAEKQANSFNEEIIYLEKTREDLIDYITDQLKEGEFAEIGDMFIMKEYDEDIKKGEKSWKVRKKDTK